MKKIIAVGLVVAAVIITLTAVYLNIQMGYYLDENYVPAATVAFEKFGNAFWLLFFSSLVLDGLAIVNLVLSFRKTNT